MNRLLCTLAVLLFIAPATQAQDFRLYGGVGANYSRGNFNGLNYVLGRYNQTRQGQANAATVTRPMGDINALSGFSWQLGFLYEFGDFTLSLGFNRAGKRAETYAEVTDINGNNGRRDVKFTANASSVESALGARTRFGYLSLGGSMDFLRAKSYTRINSNDYDEVMDDSNIGFTLFTDINIFITENFALGFKPYYHVAALESDFTPLNRAINSATYSRDSYEDQSSRVSNYGLQVYLRIFSSVD